MSYRSMQPLKATHVLNRQQVDLPQVLWNLRNDDPAFGGRIRSHHLELRQVLASGTELKRQMYILVQGHIHLVYDNEGRRLVINTLEPGAIFGEGALSNPKDVNVVAEAATKAIVWSIPAAEARETALHYPILAWGLLQTCGKRLQQIENSLEDTAYKRLPERLAALLVDLSNGENGSIQGISHQELAERLGTYRETVSAHLREFKDQGLLHTGHRRIDIIDVETLKELAGIWEK